MTPEEIRQLALAAQLPDDRIRQWANDAMQAAMQDPMRAKGLQQGASSSAAVSGAYTPLTMPTGPIPGLGASIRRPPPSAATIKLRAFISESIGELASEWVETVLVRRELLPKLMNMPTGLQVGAFAGNANVVVVRFEPSIRVAQKAAGAAGPVAVFAIPQSILDELVAEDVAAALDPDAAAAK